MRRPIALGVACIGALAAIAVGAQTITNPPAVPDLSGYALTSSVPTPGVVVPPSETVAGATGTMTGQFALANHTHPRITRATTVTTTAGGVFAVTWATAFPSAPNIVLTPIVTGGSAVTCELTAAPTTTTVAGRCWTSQSTLLSLSIVTAGITVAPNAASAAGVQVQVLGIPPTQ